MKIGNLILSLLLLFTAGLAHADIQGAPFMPEVDVRFNAIEQGNHLRNNKFPMGSTDGHWVQQLAQATYDYSVQGGLSTVPFDLGVPIPAGAIITRSFLYSITKPTSAVAANLGWYCASASGFEFKQPTLVTSYAPAASSIDGTQSGAAANFSVIPTACTVKAKVGGVGALTAGKVTLFINYVVHQ